MRKSEGVGFPRTWASDLNGGDKRVTLGETRRFDKEVFNPRFCGASLQYEPFFQSVMRIAQMQSAL